MVDDKESSRKRPKLMKSQDHKLDAKHETFTRWSRDRGVIINSVKPAALSGKGIGLVATKEIATGELLLFIPEKAMFKYDPQKLAPKATGSPQAMLAITLARKCFPPESPYRTWETTWPSNADLEASMPFFWPDWLRKWLPQPAKELLDRQVSDYARDVCTSISSRRKDTNDYKILNFSYYWAITNSRSFYFRAGASAGQVVMCPFVDYMNHGPSGTGVQVKQVGRAYEVRANKKYGPGEEITSTYGAHSNDKLLVDYGFINPTKPGEPSDDDICLDHLMVPNFSLQARENLSHFGFLGGYVLLPSTNEVCFKTQVAVRAIIGVSNKELEHFIANGEDLSHDRTGEVKSWLDRQLARYRTEAIDKLDGLKNLESIESEHVAVRLLIERWTQIRDALEVFLRTA